jgi:hypothetical protein
MFSVANSQIGEIWIFFFAEEIEISGDLLPLELSEYHFLAIPTVNTSLTETLSAVRCSFLQEIVPVIIRQQKIIAKT